MRALPLILLTSALCFCLYRNTWEKNVLPGESLNGTEAEITGTVLDWPEEAYHKNYYLIRVERVSLEGRDAGVPVFTARISSWQALSCEPGDRVESTVAFSAFQNTGELYSVRNSRWADGIAAGGYLSDYEDISVYPQTGVGLEELACRLRREIGRGFDRALSQEEAGLIRAMLLGEKDRVSDGNYSNFQKAGVSHLLAVSGLHMTILAAFFALFLRMLPLKRTGRNLITGLFILFYLFLIGLPVSALRSGIMFLLFLLADCRGAEADSLNSLGFAVLLICLWNPFAGGDLGFAASVSSTLGILLLSDPIEKKLLHPFKQKPMAARLLRPAAASLGVTVGAVTVSLPVLLAAFGGVSILTPLANLVLIFPCTLLLYCAASAAFLGLLPAAGLASPFLFCAGELSRLILWLTEALARLPVSFVSFSQPDLLLALGLLAGLTVFLALLWKGRAACCIVLAAALLFYGCGSVGESSLRKGKVTLAAAADSSCVIAMRDGHAAVLALGGFHTGAAVSLLSENNIRHVDTLCMSVRDPDAREAAVQILNTYGADLLVLPEDAYLGRDLALAGKKAARLTVKDGESFEVLDGVQVTAGREMDRMCLSLGGVSVMVETAPSGNGDCHVLFTNQTSSRINSSFTVVQNDDILEENGETPDFEKLGELPSGRYLLPGEGGLFVDLFQDGTVSVRGESLCLK